MKRMLAALKASGAFIGTLFRPSEPSAGRSLNGHVVLSGWSGAPEEGILSALRETRRARAARAKAVGLFGLEGPHAGELLFAGGSFLTVGSGEANDLVVTPGAPGDQRQYRMLINGVRTLMAQTGDVFRVNGREEQRCELFDYDELEILGNRFLVLDLSAGGSHDGAASGKGGER